MPVTAGQDLGPEQPNSREVGAAVSVAAMGGASPRIKLGGCATIFGYPFGEAAISSDRLQQETGRCLPSLHPNRCGHSAMESSISRLPGCLFWRCLDAAT
jgi:hypothetical protein